MNGRREAICYVPVVRMRVRVRKGTALIRSTAPFGGIRECEHVQAGEQEQSKRR